MDIYVSDEGLKKLIEDLRPKYPGRHNSVITVTASPVGLKLRVALSDEDYQRLVFKDVTDRYSI